MCFTILTLCGAWFPHRAERYRHRSSGSHLLGLCGSHAWGPCDHLGRCGSRWRQQCLDETERLRHGMRAWSSARIIQRLCVMQSQRSVHYLYSTPIPPSIPPSIALDLPCFRCQPRYPPDLLDSKYRLGAGHRVRCRAAAAAAGHPAVRLRERLRCAASGWDGAPVTRVMWMG